MKAINKYSTWLILVTVMFASLASCTKDLLNKQPLDALSGPTFWKTAGDASLGLAGVYNRLKSGFNGYQKVYLDCMADEAYNAFDYLGSRSFGLGLISSTSVASTTMWQTNYQGISSCNIFLQNVPPIIMDEKLKAQEIAEVKFLRAYFYFNLVFHFGDVILYREPPTLQDANVARTSKDSVLNFIYNDLDSAIANLPDVSYNGHVVKGSALALQAKIYLYNQQWSKAADLSNQVIQSGVFSLYSNYAGLFYSKSQTNNPEILFSTQYLAPDDLQAGSQGGLDIELGFFNADDPYQQMVDSYETLSGKLINEPGSGYDPSNPYANRDPRLHASIKVPGQVWYNPDGSVYNPATPTYTGYTTVKYIDTTLLPIAYNQTNKNDEDVIHLRYADVLLMYAEAQNELSGPDATIYTVLNQIRARVNMPPVDQTEYGTQGTLREFIRHERKIELAFEGNRYDDLIRWKIAEQVMPLITTPGGAIPLFTLNNYLMPIPQHDLSVDKRLTQNPGY